jgi:hypothetical protein
MNMAESTLTEFSGRLLAHDTALGKHGSTGNSDSFLVCEKLRGPLGRLTGVGGFRSLLSRALALAGAEVPSLRALHIREDGSLEGVEKLGEKLDPREIVHGELVLVSQLLGLLVTFIGPALTERLVRDIWPEMKDISFLTEKTL